MLKRKLATGILAIALWAAASAVQAQNGSEAQPFQPFGGFFRSLFGEPIEQENRRPPPTPNVQRYGDNSSGYVRPAPQAAQPLANSIPPAPSAKMSDVPDEPPTGFAAQAVPSPTPARRNSPTVSPASTDRATATADYSFQWDAKAASQPASSSPQPSTGAAVSSGGDSAITGGSASPTAPLHERMKSFRRSPFEDVPSSAATSAGGASDPPIVRQADRTATVGRSANSEPAGPMPTLAAPRAPAGVASGGPLPQPQEQPVSSPAEQRPPAGARPPDESGSEKPSAAVGARLSAAARTAPPHGDDSGVLFAQKSPILAVETAGPRRIVVGKEAAYEVTIQNSGEIAADDVTVYVTLPPWADVVNATSSVGEARGAPQGRTDPLQWLVGHLEPKAGEKLVLKIVPRESRPFELAVRKDYRPASTQATIEVQEPKLVMGLDGPREVFFNKREVYKLKLANTGNGPAENVTLTLMPVTTGQTQPISHKLGTLAAGEHRTMEVELTARQPGNLLIQVQAKGDGSARAELSERVVVHRGGLAVELDGPAVQYVGTTATYKIRLRNPGDAVAKNIRLAVDLPVGVKYLSGSDGAQVPSNGGKVQWTFDRLEPGGQQAVLLRCALARSGPARLEAASTADDELTAAAETTTQVQAMADLRLELKDADGPVPLSEETTYELHVRNRGTKTAENVEVVAYFSSGVEPTSAEGHPNRVSPGQVVFSPIPSLSPGSELVLKVVAHAQTAGNHVFRAEVHCNALGTRLVQEETTHFYQDGPAVQQAARGAPSVPPSGDALRTADRRPPLAPQTPEPSGSVPPPPAEGPPR
ncbi:MAG: hypothetical protein ABR915_18605 [Thermoguttaceae bacterium]|jgi:uncharacterized repeat protein (TIGR01451 family)